MRSWGARVGLALAVVLVCATVGACLIGPKHDEPAVEPMGARDTGPPDSGSGDSTGLNPEVRDETPETGEVDGADTAPVDGDAADAEEGPVPPVEGG